MPSARRGCPRACRSVCSTVLAITMLNGSPGTRVASSEPDVAPDVVQELVHSELHGLKVYAPDGRTFLVNAKDDRGIAQIYIGHAGQADLTCITGVQRPGGPKPDRFKMQPHWHPSGKWIFVAVERDEYSPPPLVGGNRKLVEGWLQCGLWTNMYAVSPDGAVWQQLTDFRSGTPGVPDGFTGPAITPDGTKAVWSQIVDCNIFAYWPFGRWELIVADVTIAGGAPAFSHQRTITPAGMHWNEPGNFHPDNESLLLSGSVERDAQGMDQYILNIRTGQLRNLTNSPTVWDEHGVFSPDGTRIIFMSAYPYRSDANSSKTLNIKTEFMLMHADGTGLQQITHFLQPGYTEYSAADHGIAACAIWSPDGRSALLSRLEFPDYSYWTIRFADRGR